jgi:hypothetical protein
MNLFAQRAIRVLFFILLALHPPFADDRRGATPHEPPMTRCVGRRTGSAVFWSLTWSISSFTAVAASSATGW